MKSLLSTLAAGAMALALLATGCSTTVTTNTNTAPAGNTNAGARNTNTAATNTAPPAGNTAATNSNAGGGTQGGGGTAASVEITNQTNWDIHHLYMSPVNERNWGPDQLGTRVLTKNGGQFTLTDIPCANYDIRVVDQDGDECIIEDVELCRGGYEWRITNQELLSCQGFGQ